MSNKTQEAELKAIMEDVGVPFAEGMAILNKMYDDGVSPMDAAEMFAEKKKDIKADEQGRVLIRQILAQVKTMNKDTGIFKEKKECRKAMVVVLAIVEASCVVPPEMMAGAVKHIVEEGMA